MDAISGRGELGDRGLVADFYGLGERGGLGPTGRTGGLADWWTGRTTESWTGRTGVDRVDWRTRRTGRRGVYGAGLRGRKGRTGKPEAGVPAD